MYRRISLLLMLLVVPIASGKALSAQSESPLRRQFGWLAERLPGMAAAISDRDWDRVIDQAMDSADGTTRSTLTSGATVSVRLDSVLRICYIDCERLISYQLKQSPWRVQGAYPVLQIATVFAPFASSRMTAYLPGRNSRWQIEHPKFAQCFLKEGKMSKHGEPPFTMTFAPDSPKNRVEAIARPSLSGWTTREEAAELEALLDVSACRLRLNKRGQLKPTKL